MASGLLGTPSDTLPAGDETTGSPRIVDSANGTLVVIVCRAKHLPNRRKLDKQSPYVALRLGTVAKKTSAHFRAGQIPEWTQEVRFELERDRRPLMKVDVLDETKGEPTPIGSTEVDCAVLFTEERRQDGKYIFDGWHNLLLNGRRAGMIYLEMTFYPSAPLLPPKVVALAMSVGGSYMVTSSSLPVKRLPAPPRHPQQRPKTVADDIFVTSEYEKARKHSFFHLSASSDAEPNEPGFVTSTASDPLDASPRRGRLAKLKSKFSHKEPISQLWDPTSRKKLPAREQELPEYGFDDEIEPYPLVHDEAPAPPPHSVVDIPPPTPPHSVYQSQDPLARNPHSRSPRRQSPPPQQRSPQRTAHSSPRTHSSPRAHTPLRSPHRSPVSRRSPQRKPPADSPPKPVGTSLPFSADTIGVDDEEDLPTKVFMLGEQVKSLSHSGNHSPPRPDPDHIDPKYHAPTPSEHLATTLRLQNGGVSKKDVAVDLRTEQTGYLGDGKWQQRFSPSVFDRAKEHDENRDELGFEHKPRVPPKIPQGMSEMEYYVLEKEQFLRDLNGRRA